MDFASDKEGENIKPELVVFAETKISDVDFRSLKVSVIDSGFYVFNEYSLLKKDRSELIIVAARPSVGKSALMFQIAEHVSRTEPVLIFSLEMDKEQILARMVSQRLDVSITEIQRGTIQETKVESATKQMRELKLYVCDKSGLDMHTIRNIALDFKRRHGIGLVVIDYLQLIKRNSGHSTNAEVSLVSYELKMLAKELHVPVVVGSQLNRNLATRGFSSGNFEPILSDLRDSGSIEQDADVVLLLHRDAMYKTDADAFSALGIIAKNRNGPIGRCDLKYIPHQTRFEDKINLRF